MRFDMRAPRPGSDPADLYATALDMCEWSDAQGCAAVVLCEHHGSPDGYLPSPLVLAAAIAARTRQVTILIAAAILPFHDPVRLIEDLNVLDIISRGRISCVCALGYRPEEYEHFGIDMAKRGKIADEKLGLLLDLRKGQPVAYRGRQIHVTPSAVTPGGVPILWGGGSHAAARRAGRFGIDFFAQRDLPGAREVYEAEARAHGHDPGTVILPGLSTPTAVFIAPDPDEAWDELGSYLLHDARMYGAWNPGDESTAGITHVETVEDLRESGVYEVLTPAQARDWLHGPNSMLTLMPLCGGIPPETAWRYLELAAEVSAGSN